MSKEFLRETEIVTNKIVLFRPNLFEPVSFNNTEPKYGTGIIIDKDDTDTISKIKSAIDCAIEKANFIDRENLKLPLRDGDLERPNDLLYQNSYFMYSTSITMPEVFDHNMKRLFGRTNIGNGAYAKVYIDFVPYNVRENKGISCKLYGVQTLPLKSRLLELQPDSKSVFQAEK